MRSIKNIHTAEFSYIADLVTYSPLPSSSLAQIDPFIFLNHHGPQKYPPNNNGLPFGPHPHRGMETVTFIIDGDIMHKDSGGHLSVISAGGVQWMTAGRGLIHAEVSSQDFLKNGGNLEILQLWLNLPAHLKMIEPGYLGLQKEDIPSLSFDNNKVIINLISGNFQEVSGPFVSISNINIKMINFKKGGSLNIDVPIEHNIFFYVIRGTLILNNREVESLKLVEFNNDSKDIQIMATAESILLFGHAKPFNEPIVAKGPFVMNSEEEINQAYTDYKKGKFGNWIE